MALVLSTVDWCGLVRHGVDPFPQRGLDEAFRLAVGLRRVGSCTDVAQTFLFQEIARKAWLL